MAEQPWPAGERPSGAERDPELDLGPRSGRKRRGPRRAPALLWISAVVVNAGMLLWFLTALVVLVSAPRVSRCDAMSTAGRACPAPPDRLWGVLGVLAVWVLADVAGVLLWLLTKHPVAMAPRAREGRR